MSAPHINDGYELEATIPGRGPWPPLTFRYRPALLERTMEYLAQPKYGKKGAANAIKLILEHVVSWDAAAHGKDGTLPVDEANLRKMPAPFVEDMVAVVTGYSELEQEGDVKNS